MIRVLVRDIVCEHCKNYVFVPYSTIDILQRDQSNDVYFPNRKLGSVRIAHRKVINYLKS